MPSTLYFTEDEIRYIRDLAEGRCASKHIRDKGLVQQVLQNYVRIILSGRRRWSRGVDEKSVRDFIVQLINEKLDLAREWRPWLKEGR